LSYAAIAVATLPRMFVARYRPRDARWHSPPRSVHLWRVRACLAWVAAAPGNAVRGGETL